MRHPPKTRTIPLQVERVMDCRRTCIRRRESFAIETTLRSQVTFEQARHARTAGSKIEMRYRALAVFALHLERVKARAAAGGHSASAATLRRIHNDAQGWSRSLFAGLR